MAQAIKHLFPDAKLAIGPAIDSGFYYDIDCAHAFSQEDFPAIEKEMKKIVKENLPLEKRFCPGKTPYPFSVTGERITRLF